MQPARGPENGVELEWIEREIDDAIAPYRGLLSAADLEWMRERLRLSATEGPTATLARRAAPRVVDESGAVAYRGEDGSKDAVTARVSPDKGRGQAGGSR